MSLKFNKNAYTELSKQHIQASDQAVLKQLDAESPSSSLSRIHIALLAVERHTQAWYVAIGRDYADKSTSNYKRLRNEGFTSAFARLIERLSRQKVRLVRFSDDAEVLKALPVFYESSHVSQGKRKKAMISRSHLRKAAVRDNVRWRQYDGMWDSPEWVTGVMNHSVTTKMGLAFSKGEVVLCRRYPGGKVLAYSRRNKINTELGASSVSLLDLPARLTSNDGQFERYFDTTLYFVQASDQELIALAACGFRNGPAADEVAYWEGRHSRSFGKLLARITMANGKRDETAFKVEVAPLEAQAWIRQHRPHLQT